jgi:hypothetical protein
VLKRKGGIFVFVMVIISDTDGIVGHLMMLPTTTVENLHEIFRCRQFLGVLWHWDRLFDVNGRAKVSRGLRGPAGEIGKNTEINELFGDSLLKTRASTSIQLA